MSSAQDESIPEGGTLRVAIVGEPPAVLDSMFSTATVTNYLSQHVFEGLFTIDSSFSPQPMLVEDYSLSDDQLSYTFKLREGISFHNGDPLTSNDVLASLNRWGAINGRGRMIFDRLGSLTAPDDHTIEMVFEAPAGVLLSFLARSEAIIMPASIAESAGDGAVTEFIGTGPFRFDEHLVDQHIRMMRNDDYVPRDEEPDGHSGRRIAYLDQIDFIPVPDESVRANGVISGEYHFGDPLPPDYLDTFEMDPSVESVIVKPYHFYGQHFNKQKGVFTDPRARQAVQLAFSQSEALKAGFGRDELIRADPSIAGEETSWYSTSGADVYDNPDPEQARALLEEAGYDGTPIKWLATHEYAYNFRVADFVQQRLQDIGMEVEIIVSDWSTMLQTRADPDAMDIFVTGHPQYSHPATHVFNDPSWPGFWESEARDAAVNAMIEASDDSALANAIDEYTGVIWSEMPFVKIGDNFVLRAISTDVVGYVNTPDWFFWNVGLQ